MNVCACACGRAVLTSCCQNDACWSHQFRPGHHTRITLHPVPRRHQAQIRQHGTHRRRNRNPPSGHTTKSEAPGWLLASLHVLVPQIVPHAAKRCQILIYVEIHVSKTKPQAQQIQQHRTTRHPRRLLTHYARHTSSVKATLCGGRGFSTRAHRLLLSLIHI